MSSLEPRGGGKQPSVVPGITLLVVAAVLILIVLINPSMSQGLRVTIAITAVVVVLVLLGWALKLFLSTQRGSKR